MVRRHKSVCTVQQHPGEPLEKHYHHHLPQEENPLAVKKSLSHNPEREKWLSGFSETTKSPEQITIHSPEQIIIH